MYRVKHKAQVVKTFELFSDAWIFAVQLTWEDKVFSIIIGPDIEEVTVNPPALN